ncbi:S49 family peptidase [bacterium]|nr:S49 family peptidase [bacterium]
MAIWWQQTPRFLQVPSMRYSLGNNLDAMPLRRPSMLRINRNRPLRSVKPGLSGVSISRSYILISRFETGCYTPTFMKLEKWIVMLLLVLFGLSAASVLWSRVLPRDRTGAAPLWHESAIGVIEINGPIDASRSGVFESGGFQSILEQIHSHRDDDRVKALIIRINSPGGTVGASQEIYQELKRFRSKTHKPIVVSITDLGASGAYWVAMAGDVIVANPGINYNCGVDEITVCVERDGTTFKEPNGSVLTYQCDPFGRIRQVQVLFGGTFSEHIRICIHSKTGVNVDLIPVFEVIRDPLFVDKEKNLRNLVQVYDLVGLSVQGYVDGKPYYGKVYFENGQKFAGVPKTGKEIPVYNTRVESIQKST